MPPTGAATAAGPKEQGQHRTDQCRRHRHQQAGSDHKGNDADQGAGRHRTGQAAQHAARHRTHHRHHKKQKYQQVYPLKTVAATGVGRRRCRQRQLFASDPGHQLVHPGIEPGQVITLLEGRGDGGVDDAFGGQIGDGAFQGLGHLDPNLTVVQRHDQQQAVADLAPADLPAVSHPVGVAGDVLRLGGGHQQHHDLCAAPLLECGQPAVELLHAGCRQSGGGVHHMAAERRYRQLGPARQQGEQGE